MSSWGRTRSRARKNRRFTATPLHRYKPQPTPQPQPQPQPQTRTTNHNHNHNHKPEPQTTNHNHNHKPQPQPPRLGTQHPFGCWQGYRRVEIVALSSGVRPSCLQRIRGVNGRPLLGTRLDPGNSRSRCDQHVQATDQKKFNSKVLHMVWEARQRLWAPAHDVTENRGVTSRLPVYCTLCPCDSMRPDLRNSRSRCAQQATGIHDGIISDTVRLVWEARL